MPEAIQAIMAQRSSLSDHRMSGNSMYSYGAVLPSSDDRDRKIKETASKSDDRSAIIAWIASGKTNLYATISIIIVLKLNQKSQQELLINTYIRDVKSGK